MKKINIKDLNNSDDAVVGIIVAVLLIGLILVVISIFQTVFIPNWMEQIEAEHMDDVAQQFSQLKFAIDIHRATIMVYSHNSCVTNLTELAQKYSPVTPGEKGVRELLTPYRLLK